MYNTSPITVRRDSYIVSSWIHVRSLFKLKTFNIKYQNAFNICTLTNSFLQPFRLIGQFLLVEAWYLKELWTILTGFFCHSIMCMTSDCILYMPSSMPETRHDSSRSEKTLEADPCLGSSPLWKTNSFRDLHSNLTSIKNLINIFQIYSLWCLTYTAFPR